MWFTDWIFALTTGISNDGGGRLHIASSPTCVLAFMFSIHITADAAPAYQFPTPFSYWWTRCKSTWNPPLGAPAHSPLAKLNITISWSQPHHKIWRTTFCTFTVLRNLWKKAVLLQSNNHHEQVWPSPHCSCMGLGGLQQCAKYSILCKLV